MNLIGGETQYLLVKRGDTLKLNFVFNVPDSDIPLDLTGCTARLYLKFLRTNALIVDASTENGLLVIEPEAGLVKLEVPAYEMTNAPIGRHKFDLELTFPDGSVLSSETNTLEIVKDVTAEYEQAIIPSQSGSSGVIGYSGYSGRSGWSGYSGAIGISGYSGINGTIGLSGFSGYSGIDGIIGDSGYSGINGTSGYSGVEGVSGISGYSGIDGLIGISGYSGKIGTYGFSGYSGIDGSIGISGYSGIDGSIGASGYSGISGFSGYSGAASPAGGGTKTLAVFTPMTSQPPATAFATLDTRNSIAVLDFDDGATNEATTFVGIIPEGADLSSGILARIFWMATSATSGDCRWGVQFEKYGTDNDADSFDTATEAHTTSSGTSGIAVVTEITATAIDSLAAGDQFRLKLYRDSSDTSNDTLTGDAELIAVELRGVA